MTGSRPSQNRALTAPFGIATALHVAVAAVLIVANSGESRNMPPPVSITMVAAPVGARAVGVVEPAKSAPDKPVPSKAREVPKTTTTKRVTPPKTQKVTASVPKPATPPPKTTVAPKAGGGPEGGKGTDVTNVKLDGVEFPYPAYLNNIVNQVRQRFTWTGPATYRADIAFLIRRDGSVSEIRVVGTPTGNYAFRTEALGAIEAAGKSLSFGKLPDGFADDVLPIVFSFDPKIIGR